jgi:hypothetical protein
VSRSFEIQDDKTCKVLYIPTMKKLILSLAISAFALTLSVQADSNSTTTTKAPAAKKATCTDSSKDCCSGGKSACKSMPSKTVLMSPKAAALAGKS